MIDECDLDLIFNRTRPLWELLRGERIFITGGTGFVGSWLVASFARANRELQLGARAVVLTRDPDAAAIRMAELGADAAIDLLHGDGTNFAAPTGRFAFVIHAATQRSFVPTRHEPLGIMDADARTTRRVLDFAHGAGTRRMLFTSSGAVYGRQPTGLSRIAEDYSGAPLPTDCDAAYGHSKRYSETQCAMYARACGINVSVARIFAAVGPFLPLNENYAVGNFIGDALDGRAIRVSGDGTPLRTYLYAADLATWLWTMLLAGESGRVYNVGASDTVSIGELARLVALETGARVPVEIARSPSEPPAAATRYVPDTRRAKDELGLHASVPLREAIRRTFAWHRRRTLHPQRSLC